MVLSGDRERGAIGVLVAILIGAGVLFGMGALVIDVGQIYENRAELQNGADAGALAVAKSCAQGTCTPTIAAGYANANASSLTGGTAYVNVVCGVSGNGTVGAGRCTATNKACPPNPPSGANYVDVETSTQLPNGSHLLPPVFARTLVGDGSYRGTTVYACAQAEWGGPLTAVTSGFTISACTWDASTNSGTALAPPPPYPPNPKAALDQVIYLKGVTSAGCPTEPNGAAGPGEFGWTDDTGTSPCTISITNGTYGGNMGNSAPQACQSVLSAAQQQRTVVYVPVYTSVTGNGAQKTTFTLKGFGAFVVTGYKVASFKAKDWITGAYPCSGSKSCISGFFTSALVDTPGTLGGTNLGADIIKLTG
jgi:Flp pilus assembly protein TadG